LVILIHHAAFPFAAVLGQDDIKKALLWNIVNPDIGGVLISGEKGTAKSTLVRGVNAIAHGIRVVDLPLNITEDRLIGNIDFEHAVKCGEKRFEAGLLQKADGNILYVDEVNLLSDHIVKALLESASSGVNIVEREGISYQHEAKFILVGSMNPEEGGLRPQFLDRFGLYVEVKGEEDIRKRSEIARRRIEYEQAPAAFLSKWQVENEKLALLIRQAREMLPQIIVSENAMTLAASVARESNCAGHRAELVIIETARAIAALGGRTVLNITDIKEAAKFALPHRARQAQEQPPERQDPSDDRPDSGESDRSRTEQPDDAPNNSGGNPTQNDQSSGEDQKPQDQRDETQESAEDNEHGIGEQPETVFDTGELFNVSRWLSEDRDLLVKRGSGRRSIVTTGSMQGRYVRYGFPKGNDIRDIAIDATLRAAASHQKARVTNGTAVAIDTSDIRVKIRERRTGNTIVFVVDASGSMGANRQMSAVKGAILSLLNDAYQKRDKISLIAFRKDRAELLLGVTRSVELAEKKLAVLPTGGVTPLAAGLDMAYEVVKAAKLKDKDMLPVIVLVTDGRATYSARSEDAFGDALRAASRIGAEGIKSVVIDTDRNFIKLHLAEKLAAAMEADRFEIDDIRAQTVLAAVALSL
jgi:magnesium chelatase subunit D